MRLFTTIGGIGIAAVGAQIVVSARRVKVAFEREYSTEKTRHFLRGNKAGWKLVSDKRDEKTDAEKLEAWAKRAPKVSATKLKAALVAELKRRDAEVAEASEAAKKKAA